MDEAKTKELINALEFRTVDLNERVLRLEQNQAGKVVDDTVAIKPVDTELYKTTAKN